MKLNNTHQQIAFDCTKRVRDNYLKNDLAHRLDHAHAVMRDAVHIAGLISAQHLIPQLIAAAYYHDIHRLTPDTHNVLAYEEVFSDSDFIKGIGAAENDDEIHAIALACLEHRASWSGEYSGVVSEIIAAADRGAPDRTDVNFRMRRSYLYGRDTLGMCHLTAQQHAMRYVKDLYGVNGNARYPQIYKTVYAHELLAQAVRIDKTLVSDVPWQKFMLEFNKK